MPAERPHSIRARLTRVVLAATFLALTLAGLAMVVFDLRSYQKTWEDDLLAQADLLGLATAPALAFNDPKAAGQNLALLKARHNILAAAVITPDGRLFATYGDMTGGLPARGPDGVRVEGADLVAFKQVRAESELLGSVYLRARHERLARLQNYLAVLAGVVVASLLLALAVSNRLLAVATQPILDVSQVARRITATRDYSLRATRTTNDEVGQVVDAFNDMLAELARRADGLEQAHARTLQLNAELEERVRRRTAQLETANSELEAFSYSASHDLRAPVHSIDSFGKLLERLLGDKLDERGRHYLHRIQENARVMSLLIDALLTLAHVSRAPLDRGEVDLGELALAAAERLRELEPHRKAVVDIAPGLVTQADATLVAQVMNNLVGNAWKFTSHTPQARITVGRQGEKAGAPVYFVRDNGAGFDMDHAQRLFSAFQRLHTPAEFPGTGVGLATVHKIVTRHEGRIWAESAPGQGATFYFTLMPPS
jgi:signal transduction histidine kinase